MVPGATQFRGQEKIPGTITLRADGLEFSGLLLGKEGQYVIHCHLDAIDHVTEARWSENLGVILKSGEEFSFGFAGARKWAKPLTEMLPKPTSGH